MNYIDRLNLIVEGKLKPIPKEVKNLSAYTNYLSDRGVLIYSSFSTISNVKDLGKDWAQLVQVYISKYREGDKIRTLFHKDSNLNEIALNKFKEEYESDTDFVKKIRKHDIDTKASEVFTPNDKIDVEFFIPEGAAPGSEVSLTIPVEFNDGKILNYKIIYTVQDEDNSPGSKKVGEKISIPVLMKTIIGELSAQKNLDIEAKDVDEIHEPVTVYEATGDDQLRIDDVESYDIIRERSIEEISHDVIDILKSNSDSFIIGDANTHFEIYMLVKQDQDLGVEGGNVKTIQELIEEILMPALQAYIRDAKGEEDIEWADKKISKLPSKMSNIDQYDVRQNNHDIYKLVREIFTVNKKLYKYYRSD